MSAIYKPDNWVKNILSKNLILIEHFSLFLIAEQTLIGHIKRLNRCSPIDLLSCHIATAWLKALLVENLLQGSLATFSGLTCVKNRIGHGQNLWVQLKPGPESWGMDDGFLCRGFSVSKSKGVKKSIKDTVWQSFVSHHDGFPNHNLY